MVTFTTSNTVLSSRISELLGAELRMAGADIDRDAPLMEYGLDSIAALTVAGQLEEELGVELPSTLLWDCPTVHALADYLADALQVRDSAVPVSHG